MLKQTLEELASVPGVHGGYLLHPKQGIGVNLLPATFTREKLAEVSRQLLKIFAASRMNFKSMKDLSLHFDGLVLYLRQISEQLFLVAICAPTVNTNVLSMSVSLAIEELAQQETSAEQQQISAPVPVASPSPAEPKLTAENVRESGPLAAPLDSLEEALSAVMGPMAEMIMEDAISDWFQAGQASFESLPALIRILCGEIGDTDKVARFQSSLGQYGLH